jgi:hypothetical protein
MKGALAKRRNASPALDVEKSSRIQVPFLNPSVRTNQAMIRFNDRLILGTARPPLGFLGRFTGR